MSQVRVVPKKGPVYNPETGGLLRRAGAVVSVNAYWAKRIGEGAVTVEDLSGTAVMVPAPAEPEPVRQPAPAAAPPDAPPEPASAAAVDVSTLSWDDLKDFAKAHGVPIARRTRDEIEQDLETALVAAAEPQE